MSPCLKMPSCTTNPVTSLPSSTLRKITTFTDVTPQASFLLDGNPAYLRPLYSSSLYSFGRRAFTLLTTSRSSEVSSPLITSSKSRVGVSTPTRKRRASARGVLPVERKRNSARPRRIASATWPSTTCRATSCGLSDDRGENSTLTDPRRSISILTRRVPGAPHSSKYPRLAFSANRLALSPQAGRTNTAATSTVGIRRPFFTCMSSPETARKAPLTLAGFPCLTHPGSSPLETSSSGTRLPEYPCP